MTNLVDFLKDGEHPVELARYATAVELKERIERGYVLVKFTDTRGGTELGLRLDSTKTETSNANFESASGLVSFCGTLTLDFVKIEVSVKVDLATLTGSGTVAEVQFAELAD